MLPLYMTVAAVFFTLTFYLYGSAIHSRGRRGTWSTMPHRGRDMWKASLLDCDYEPAKYVFGPGKAIPAEKVFTRESNDTPFFVHMEND